MGLKLNFLLLRTTVANVERSCKQKQTKQKETKNHFKQLKRAPALIPLSTKFAPALKSSSAQQVQNCKRCKRCNTCKRCKSAKAAKGAKVQDPKDAKGAKKP